MQEKIVSAADAIALIEGSQTVTTSGFVGIGVPDALLKALEQRFLETGGPRELTLLFAAGQGDGADRGLNRLGHERLLKRVVGGHWGLIPKIGRLAMDNLIEAYNLPQGVISHLYRDIAAGKPGVLSKVGLDTFVDPRRDGGRLNARSTEELVTLMSVGGEEHLFYKGFPIHVALLRGTTADENGNVTMEREALVLDNLSQAMAAKNSGGAVIVQVERIAAKRSLPSRDVVIPGALVDAIVVAEPVDHMQTYATQFSAVFAGRHRGPEADRAPTALDARKIIARRAAFELPINGVVNLGIGMPEGVANVAAEEGLLKHLTLTAEPGVIGGQPASGLDFGAAANTDAVVTQAQQFDFYDGGGLDLAVLGMAEVDAGGSVNVSRFGPRLAGAGGFINISQNARRLVFAGSFTAGGLRVRSGDGLLAIEREGASRKFVEAIGHITFSGPGAAKRGRRALFITERCVFELRPDGLALIEIAPGVDMDRHILPEMAFRPIIEEVRTMDARIFSEAPMSLRGDLLHLDLADRVALDAQEKRLFLNFEKMRIRSSHDVARIDGQVRRVCLGLGHRVDVIVNYDGAYIDPDVESAYAEMVRNLENEFYGQVTRYSGSAFMRVKLGDTFRDGRAAHIFETAEQARAFLDDAAPE